MWSSTAARAPTDSMTEHNSRTCASVRSVPIEDRSSAAATGSELSGALDCLGQQHGAFAGPQVVAGGFAGDCGVTEHAQDVVAQLERDAQVGAEFVEDGLDVGPVGGGGRAQLQRARHRVGRRLVGVDVHRRLDGFGTAGLGDDVEVLPAEHLGADVGPHPLHPVAASPEAGPTPATMSSAHTSERSPSRIAADRPNCSAEPCQRAAAMQLGEMHVCGGHTAPGGGVVDDVVVHQRAGVQQFQRGEQPQGRRRRQDRRDSAVTAR